MANNRSPSLPCLDRKPLHTESLPLLGRQHGIKDQNQQNWKPQAATINQPYTDEQEDELRRNSISILEFNRHSNHAAQHQQNTPLYKKLFSSLFSVLNPNSSLYDLSSNLPLGTDTYSVRSGGELEASIPTRADILLALRPEKLIGQYKVVADWSRLFRHDVDSIKNRALRQFYEDQNYLIERYTEIDHFLDNGQMHLNMLSTYTNSGNENKAFAEAATEENQIGEAMQKSTSRSRHNDLPGNIREGGQFLGVDSEHDSQVYLAIMVNFFINFLLLIGKIVIALLTSSLSVVASLVDSVLDFLSTFIIFIANRLSTTKNWETEIAYPVGRTKFEPIGILVFSVIIIISFFQVGLESFKKLFLDPLDKVAVKIGWDAVIIMLTTILAKVGCWIWCASSKSSSVQALAQDAMTDIIFNSISLIMPATGYALDIWWLDPAGALLLSIYVIASWSMTAFEHIENLAGAVADPKDYKVVLYLAYRFAECIKQITALKVYHAGDNLTVEIDLVFDTENFNLSFRDAHDIAEALQYAIETLPMVERAFVHIDYMEGNFKGHLT
ncbi:hypothetical protein PUMCH_002322 [Australozyma saopauloensis]|uniref:Cation efflux protein transmembrane domain-containing protein n=1 Tax=Australozyma saopauloensis TaxID=291208 RepID=A0AAX4H944_9ASCO|nr:hypothetical protein PUMCH_002322 [[Candida] saopauloensis]